MHEAFETLMARAKQLQEQGKNFSEAHGIADLERRIQTWPNTNKRFDGHLHVIIFGDFSPPKSTMSVPELDLTIFPEPLEKSVARARTVLKAKIAVDGQTVEAVQDACRRLDLFAGVWVLANWGQSPVNWWSWITHESGGGTIDDLDKNNCSPVIRLINAIPDEQLQKRVRNALYWIQEPQRGMLESVVDSSRAIRVFVAYWSAFECLVTGLTGFAPEAKMTRAQKSQAITNLVYSWRDNDSGCPDLTSERVVQLHKIVNPGLRAKSEHVFRLLFREPAQVKKYMDQCFDRSDSQNQLYQVRNDISHGNIDASDPLETIRVQARIGELWMIVWGMFGRIVPYSTPLDRDFPPADK